MWEVVLIAIVSWVYINILAEPGMIFGWLRKLVNRWVAPLSDPLVNCEYCNAGQIALWFYLIKYWCDYDIFEHIAYISVTIFLVMVINQFINKERI